MSGDALGAVAEGYSDERIAVAFPAGLQTMLDGRYTDDFQMTLALARSLVRRRRCDALDAAASYAAAFDPDRGYAPGAHRILAALRHGADPRTTGTMTAPEGSYANGGAMRISPCGLAYRNASPGVLRAAVQAALLPTHIHPLAIDGALMQAAAVGWLSLRDAAAADCSPAALVAHLQTGVDLRMQEAKDRLAILAQAIGQEVGGALLRCSAFACGGSLCARAACTHPRNLLTPAIQSTPILTTCQLSVARQPRIASWSAHLQSPTWLQGELSTSQRLAPGFQIEATAAVSAALWALCCHWDSPLDAVVAAVHAGGDTDTLASMAGALAGALHGPGWVPEQWVDALENGPEDGREAALRVAEQLAELDCTEAVAESVV